MLLKVWIVWMFIVGAEAIVSFPVEPREAKIGEFPWLATIRHIERLIVAGTIVSRYYVVTVCPNRLQMFSPIPPERLYSNIRVVAGVISQDVFEFQGNQVRWIYYWEEHPKCQAGGITGYRSFDVSVIKVRQQFIFNELVQPMPFIRDQKEMRRQVEDIIKHDRTCTFAGFGAVRYISIDMGVKATGETYQPVYFPDVHPDDPPNRNAFPHILRAIDMSVMSIEECRNRSNRQEFKHFFHYMRLPESVDQLCVIGRGEDGDAWGTNRSGVPCTNDMGGPLVCDTAKGPLVIGHMSYPHSTCRILWFDYPAIFTRFDWAIHPWLNKFYGSSMFDEHWVEPTFPEAKEFCPTRLLPYVGHMPPDMEEHSLSP